MSEYITATVTNTNCSEPPAFVKKLLAENPGVKMVRLEAQK